MPDRLIVAYSVIALMALVAGAVIWWNIHHSRRRTEARRRKKVAEYSRSRDAAADALSTGNSN